MFGFAIRVQSRRYRDPIPESGCRKGRGTLPVGQGREETATFQICCWDSIFLAIGKGRLFFSFDDDDDDDGQKVKYDGGRGKSVECAEMMD